MEHTIVIKENHIFRRLYHRGKYQAHPLLVTYALKNRLPHNRYGITASKKVGCAVKRNRARRVIREAVRSLNLDMSQSWDIILVARSRTAKAKSYEVAPQIEKRLRDAGVINA